MDGGGGGGGVVVHHKVLARRVSSRPMDAHFWKKHKENSPNLLYVLEKHAFWTASFQCLAKSLVHHHYKAW